MKALASFIMRGRQWAVLVSAVAAVLSLYLPPLSYISGAAVTLVVLRHGAFEGALVTIGAVLASALFGWVAMGTPAAAAGFLIVLWLPLYLAALVLRRSVSLALTFEVAAGMAGLGVLGDPGAWWQALVEELSRQIPAAALGDQAAEVSRVMTGLAASAALASLLASLLLARWWQALLYNPGGFRREFHALRMGRGARLVALALFAGASLGADQVGALSTNLALVAVVLFLFEGVAVVHGVVARMKLAQGWLVALYALLLLALPQMAVLLSALGYADAWVDFRSRVKPRDRND
ncbi:hypothetical protein [Endothiovibrio diazotrophicus]